MSSARSLPLLLVAATLMLSLAAAPGGAAASSASLHARQPSAGATPVVVKAPLRKVLALVNKERGDRGLKPLRLTRCLTDKAAQPWARHMAATEVLVHQDLRKVFRKCPGLTMIGENIAYGYPTAKSVMNGWMHSKGHRQNILRPRFTKIGLGLARAADGTPYWVQDFGR